MWPPVFLFSINLVSIKRGFLYIIRNVGLMT